MKAMKKIYQDLTAVDLLSKCLHGQTQNPNESFNNIVWLKIPKTTFVRLDSFRLGVFDAVLTFNNGHSSKLAIFKQLGLNLCARSFAILKCVDVIWLKKAEKAAAEITKEGRQTKRSKRKLKEDEECNENDPDYGARMF